MTSQAIDRDQNPASILCIYHNDPDGCCAAAVVRVALGNEVVLESHAIGDRVPWDRIEAAQEVILVDLSFPLETMQRLKEGWRLTWIDHHKSAFAELSDAMTNVPGQRSLDAAACVLSWQTYFPDQPVPRAVAYVGDRDIWRMAYPETRAFSEGLYEQDFRPENDAFWHPLLKDDKQQVEALIERGGLIYDIRLRTIEEVVTHYGFETTFEGHRTLAVNHRSSGDLGEYIRDQGYTLAYCYVEVVRSNKLQTKVTLYSDQVDVSEIARRYGGGGHRGAAGFQFLRSDRPFPEGSETTGLSESI